MFRYRMLIEGPWAGADHEWEAEFDHEPTVDELVGCIEVEYANHFPSSWERIEDDE